MSKNLSVSKDGKFVYYKKRENCLASVEVPVDDGLENKAMNKITHFYNFKELDNLIQFKAGIFEDEIVLLSEGGLMKFCKNKTIFNLKSLRKRPNLSHRRAKILMLQRLE